MKPQRLRLALAVAAACAITVQPASSVGGNTSFDPLLDGAASCAPAAGGPPALFRNLVLAAAETAPFQPVPAKPALADTPVLYGNLGTVTLKAGTGNAKAQAWFDQGVRLMFGFNHAEAIRAFREAQKLDPRCALCYWGESLSYGPNINVPMMPEANAPALAALAKAVELAPSAPPRDRDLIAALAKRYSARPEGRARRARRGVRRGDEAGRGALSGGEHGPGAVCRSNDGHTAVGLLGGRWHEAQGPRRGDCRGPGNGTRGAARTIRARSTCTSTQSRPRPRRSGRCRLPTGSGP